MKNKIFKVTVRETYEKTVEVLASNLKEAQEKVEDSEIKMAPENYKEGSFEIIASKETPDTLDSLKMDYNLIKQKCSAFDGPMPTPNKELQELFYLEDKLKNLIK